MNIYKVKLSEDIFEYEFLVNTNSLADITNKLRISFFEVLKNELTNSGNSTTSFPYDQFNLDIISSNLNSNDMYLIRSTGGTLLYKPDSNTSIYLVDLEHRVGNFRDNYDTSDDWESKIGGIISSIKRDLSINNIINEV